jgi:nucleoside-diphosphate-sugar epimerase
VSIDKVYNLAANMGGIGFISSVFADVMYDNVLINTHMIKASVENKVKRFFFSSSGHHRLGHHRLGHHILTLHLVETTI